MSSDLNAWSLSKRAGESMEASFLRCAKELCSLDLIKENTVNVRGVDMSLTCGVESKFLQRPYPSSPTPAGLPASKHLTLDTINVEKYPPNTIIYLVTDYRAAGVDTVGVFWITAGRVQEIMAANPKRIYTRSYRTGSDKVRKVAVSTDECSQWLFPGMSAAETVDYLKGAA